MLRNQSFRWKDMIGRQAFLLVWAPIALVSFLHYGTGSSMQWAHDIFRRLYYVPIVLAAFAYGARGALAASVMASIVYLPHAFTHMFHRDPADSLEKILEILLYNVIALVAGVLADKEFAERRKQEKTAAELRAALDEKNEVEKLLVRAGRLQALGELTAGLAHEIRNPLASIQGAAETIVDEIPSDSPKQKMADILMRELKRLGLLLDRFLSFARPESFDVSEISACDSLRSVVQLFESQAAKGGVAIELTEPSADVIVLGEKDKVLQVLMNLVINAIQATPQQGRVLLSCAPAFHHKKRYGRIRVEDSGAGVPDLNIEKIFNPFFTTKDSGSGLGLAVAARIVDQHRGFIEVSKSDLGGARFDMFLPVPE